MNQNEKSQRRFKKRTKKWLITIGIVISAALLLSIGYTALLYNKTKDTVTDSHQKVGRDDDTSALRSENVDPVEDDVSILFIGVDNSEHRNYEQGSRSDALLLATFNKADSSVKLLSIPRDSYVYVPERGYSTKINHAHFYGGPKSTIETVENFLNVPVDYFVEVNFEGFVEVVNALGGINYNVPYEMKESDSNDDKNAIHLYAGYQELNGEEALALARTRKYDSDLARGQRQLELVKTILNKATSASSVLKLGKTVDAIGSNMTTNLTFDEMKSFLSYGLDKDIEMESVSLNGNGGYMNDGLWYYQVSDTSRQQVQSELRSHLNLDSYQGSTSDFAENDQKSNTH